MKFINTIMFLRHIKHEYNVRSVIINHALRVWRARITRSYITGQSILDIGCEFGYISWIVSDKVSYTGLDLKEKALQIADNYKRPNSNFYKMDINNIDYQILPAPFDTILLIAVFEHLTNPKEVLHKLLDLLTPQGRVILTTPTEKAENYFNSKISDITCYKEAIDDHVKLYGKNELIAMIQSLGYQKLYYKKFQFGYNQILVIRKK